MEDAHHFLYYLAPNGMIILLNADKFGDLYQSLVLAMKEEINWIEPWWQVIDNAKYHQPFKPIRTR